MSCMHKWENLSDKREFVYRCRECGTMCQPKITAPVDGHDPFPRKEWVALTQEDIAKLWANSGNIAGYGGLTFENIRAVEVACKEKNNE